MSFDRERQREFTLFVTATDQADEPLIGICQITILVADQNDNDPKFENSRYQCEYLCLLLSLRLSAADPNGSFSSVVEGRRVKTG